MLCCCCSGCFCCCCCCCNLCLFLFYDVCFLSLLFIVAQLLGLFTIISKLLSFLFCFCFFLHFWLASFTVFLCFFLMFSLFTIRLNVYIYLFIYSIFDRLVRIYVDHLLGFGFANFERFLGSGAFLAVNQFLSAAS